MTEEQVLEKVREFVSIAYRSNVHDISGKTVLSELSTRSILMAGLVSMIQDEYKVTLTIPEVSMCADVAEIARLVTSKMGDKE